MQRHNQKSAFLYSKFGVDSALPQVCNDWQLFILLENVVSKFE